ncbi:hypothetical protein C8R43DRAFT_695826 [Mycena crocata]|nr:hypothetical protein C8R43DRAFT_695826 [Mycena crocata]
MTGRLAPDEIFWRDHQAWLHHCGYRLRPRYMPDWVPSWHSTAKLSLSSEDGIFTSSPVIIDAIRIRDNLDVALKRVNPERHPFELPTARLLSSPSFKDPQNHSVPILEQLNIPDSTTNYTTILVMPLLRKYSDPRFDTFGEVIDFFGQIFEGLKFMHDRNIAHRDCNGTNIMMEAAKMFPDGFHPVKTMRKRDFYSGFAKFYTRSQRPPRYYFIDFGLSRVYDSRDPPPLEPIIMGGDSSAPEFRDPIDCDPFPTDIYYLGNLIKRDFLDGRADNNYKNRFHGFEFMRSLVNDMTAEDPGKRPSIDEVIERFRVIRKHLSSWKLRSRLIKGKDLPSPFRPLVHWYYRIGYILYRVPAIPTATVEQQK